MTLTAGSFCTGYAGLDLAVEEVLDVELRWLSEIDPHASTICEARFPDVPNLGDLTAARWTDVEPVDVITAGYPCQPFSHAGKRQGTTDDRHIWPHIFDAVRVLRPRLVVLENVAGHLSLGFDTVLADLASIGFDAEWVVVRASDVGACHRRARLFVLATDAEVERQRPRRRPGEVEGPEVAERPTVEPRRRGEALPPDADEVGGQGPAAGSSRGSGPSIGGSSAPDADGRRQSRRSEPNGRTLERGDEASRRSDPHRLDAAPADADGAGLEGREPTARRDVPPGGDPWGDFGPAILRHGELVGRPAPGPTDDRGRLSALFVEWMMCLPSGWVTDLLPRNPAIRALGNGVVPPQAAHALELLLDRMEER